MLPFITPILKVIIAEIIISLSKKAVEAIEEELKSNKEK